ncbi:hypothetical protein BDV37DRAFT_129342 [Aspergillus pseudonomiae]|uniref:Uncharacterized protein n=1 Tax=Aspergillus pseudonomiae TaxID=1506151 RepID=A0A5N7DAZ1_9EURO|nr:uncharacterized protein BDV37DRAFT_129342 [Aspergillus pseudonomiae]KAE8403636.1 hypothetical protein BDV37DRAFT_129342 [Aspergillus pseudonomiae]
MYSYEAGFSSGWRKRHEIQTMQTGHTMHTRQSREAVRGATSGEWTVSAKIWHFAHLCHSHSLGQVSCTNPIGKASPSPLFRLRLFSSPSRPIATIFFLPPPSPLSISPSSSSLFSFSWTFFRPLPSVFILGETIQHPLPSFNPILLSLLFCSVFSSHTRQ